MNAKKIKAMRRHFRAVCNRNNVEIIPGVFKAYLRDLRAFGMYEEFIEKSARYRYPNMTEDHKKLDTQS